MNKSKRKYNKKGGMKSRSKSRSRSKSKKRSRSRPRVKNLQMENVDQLGLDVYRIKQDIEKIFLEINLIKNNIGLKNVSNEIVSVYFFNVKCFSHCQCKQTNFQCKHKQYSNVSEYANNKPTTFPL